MFESLGMTMSVNFSPVNAQRCMIFECSSTLGMISFFSSFSFWLNWIVLSVNFAQRTWLNAWAPSFDSKFLFFDFQLELLSIHFNAESSLTAKLESSVNFVECRITYNGGPYTLLRLMISHFLFFPRLNYREFEHLRLSINFVLAARFWMAGCTLQRLAFI